MKKAIKITVFPLLISLSVAAQSGCTDPQANNYDAQATTNDGSCEYNKSQQNFKKIGSISGYVGESSGLVLANGFIWSHNDSGNPNRIFKLDPQTGKVLQQLIVTNKTNIDWEDITSDRDYLYIGDFGNNDGDRTNLRVLKIAKTQFIESTSNEVNVTAEEIRFAYADQTNFQTQNKHNFDCEALMSIGDSLYLFTKDRDDYKTRVYHLGKDTGSFVISPREEFNVNGLITGADFDTISNTVVLIGYQQSHFNSFIWYLYDFNENQFFSGNKRRVEIGTNQQDWQTEGIAIHDSNMLYVSNENSNIVATLFSSNPSKDIGPYGVRSISKSSISIFPNPFTKTLHIQSEALIKSFSISDLNNRIIYQAEPNKTNVEIDRSSLPVSNGAYFISIETEKEILVEKIVVTN